MADAVGQVSYCVCWHPGDSFGHFRAEVLNIGRQRLKTVAPVLGEILIVKVLLDHHFDYAQGEGTVGAGSNRDPLCIGTNRRFCAAGIDYHDIRTTLGRRFQPEHVHRR